MASFSKALKRDINRLKFVEQQAKKKPVKKPKKKDTKRDDLSIFKTRDIKIVIGQAASLLHQIEIRYTKITTGETKDYRVAPYSYRYRRLTIGTRKMLFAFDMDDRHIKGFVLKNIKKAKILKRTFKPRWEVEIGMPVGDKINTYGQEMGGL